MKWNLKISYDREDGYLLPLERPRKGHNASIECPDCGKVIIDVPQNMADFDNPLSSQLPRTVECDCEEEGDE